MAPLPPRDAVRLRHMLGAASKAVAYGRRLRARHFGHRRDARAGLGPLLEIVGEAARAVSDATRDRHPTITWRQIAGTHDRLISGYEAVDLDIVRAIVATDLPAVIADVEKVLADQA